jgi:hypothetical protein
MKVSVKHHGGLLDSAYFPKYQKNFSPAVSQNSMKCAAGSRVGLFWGGGSSNIGGKNFHWGAIRFSVLPNFSKTIFFLRWAKINEIITPPPPMSLLGRGKQRICDLFQKFLNRMATSPLVAVETKITKSQKTASLTS